MTADGGEATDLFCCPEGRLGLFVHPPNVRVLDREDDEPARTLPQERFFTGLRFMFAGVCRQPLQKLKHKHPFYVDVSSSFITKHTPGGEEGNGIGAGASLLAPSLASASCSIVLVSCVTSLGLGFQISKIVTTSQVIITLILITKSPLNRTWHLIKTEQVIVISAALRISTKFNP